MWCAVSFAVRQVSVIATISALDKFQHSKQIQQISSVVISRSSNKISNCSLYGVADQKQLVHVHQQVTGKLTFVDRNQLYQGGKKYALGSSHDQLYFLDISQNAIRF